MIDLLVIILMLTEALARLRFGWILLLLSFSDSCAFEPHRRPSLGLAYYNRMDECVERRISSFLNTFFVF